jgi:SAM-dependent methyltransferase
MSLAEPAGWDRTRHRTYSNAAWVSDPELLAAILRETRGIAHDGTVVELGCGLGNLAAAFVPIASRCIGVDQDANMLRAATAQDRVQYVHSSIEGYSGTTADAVLARNVAHYVGVGKLFDKARELLRPGGLFLVCQAVPPSGRARTWHDALHAMMGVAPAPGTDDLVSEFRLKRFADIRATFHPHRMNVNQWLNARLDSTALRKTALEHHAALVDYPEYEHESRDGEVFVTVRFAIVTGLRV